MPTNRNRQRTAPLAILVICFLCIRFADAQDGKKAKAPRKAGDAASRQYATAAALHNREQWELAATEWNAFLDTFPQDDRVSRALHYRGFCELKLKKYPESIATLSKVIADDPKFELLSATQLYLGLAHFNQGNDGDAAAYPKASEAFRTLQEQYPDAKEIPSALYFWGESEYAQGNKDVAVAKYAELTNKYPDDSRAADALYALGVTQEELNQLDAAGASFAAFLKRFPKHELAMEVSMRQGESLFAAGKIDEAEKIFANAAASKGFALADHALMRQAACLHKKKQYSQAAAAYSAMIQRYPQSKYLAEASMAKGKCLYLAGEFAKCREALMPLMEGDAAQSGEAAHWIVRCQLKESQAPQGLQFVDSALAKVTEGKWRAQLMMDRADCLMEIPGQVDKAMEAYANLATSAPDDPLAPQALYMAAFSALENGANEQAVQFANDYLGRFGNHELVSDVRHVAAEAHLQLMHLPEAAALFTTLRDQNANHADRDLWLVRLGLILYLQKDYSQAVSLLSKGAGSLGSKDLNAEALYLLGSSQLELKNYQQAAKDLESALATQPKFKQADETLLALSVAYRNLNKPDQAVAALTRLEKDYPDSSKMDRVVYRLAEIDYDAGKFPEAAKRYQSIQSRWPQSSLVPHAIYGLCWCYLSQNEAAKGAEVIGDLLGKYADHPLVPKARYARGIALQQLKQFPQAIEDVNAFLASNPSASESAEAKFLLAQCQSGNGDYSAAEQTLRGILAENPNAANQDKLLYELAWALKSQEKGALAVEVFAELSRQHPDSPLAAESGYHIGEQHYQAGEFQKAAVAYYDAVKKAGKGDLGEKATHKLAWSYYRLEQYDKAQQTFKAQRTNYADKPLAGDAHFMEAECLFKQGKFKEALLQYEQLPSLSNEQFKVLSLLHAGQSAAQLKQWPQAQKHLNMAGAVASGDSPYLAEIHYEQGWAEHNQGKSDEAIKLYQQALDEAGDTEVGARACFMMGEIYFEKKDHKEAVRQFFKASTYSFPTWQAAAHYESARCFEALGNVEQAIKSYQIVVNEHGQSDKAELAKKRLEVLKKGS